MSFNFTINRNDLEAISHFQAKKDIVREYLNGVHITPNYIEATDGGALGHICTSTELDFPSLIVPENTVKLILQNTKKCSVIVCENGIANGGIVITPVQARFPFPDTSKHLNATSKSPDVVGQFDPDLLMRFKKASKALTKHGQFYMTHNGTDAATVTLPGEERFKGVVMPWRVQV